MMGLSSIAPRKRTTLPAGGGHKIYPYLLRDFDIDGPNMVWPSDITYIRLRGGFLYLTVVMDWYSRYVLSWEIPVTMGEGFCVGALERGLRLHSRPEIFNTDQGSQYTGHTFMRVLKDAKGRAMDDTVSYNNGRPHQSLGGKAPAELYFERSELGKAAQIMGCKRTVSLHLKLNQKWS